MAIKPIFGNLVQVPSNSAASPSWGDIEGTIADQTDLAGALARLQPLDTIATQVASSATPNIAAANGNIIHITGSTSISGFTAGVAGMRKILIFDGALTWTSNGATMTNYVGGSIFTQAGDYAEVICTGSNNWYCFRYHSKGGAPRYSTLTNGGNITWEPAANPFMMATGATQIITMNNPFITGGSGLGVTGVLKYYGIGTCTITGAVVTFGINSTANNIVLQSGQAIVIIGTSSGWLVIGGQYCRRNIAQKAVAAQGIPQSIASLTSIQADGGALHHVAINAWLNVLGRATNTIQMQVAWTDENGASRTQILFPMGSTTSAIAATGFVCYPQFTICTNSTGSVTVSTTFPTVGGSISYDAGCTIEQLH